MAFTGRKRDRKTKPHIKLLDRASEAVITVGGLGTIGAVLAVSLFLAWVVVPLFTGAEAEPVPAAVPAVVAEIVRIQPDEYRTMAWSLDAEGVLRCFRLDDGELIEKHALGGGLLPTAISPPASGERLAMGFEDGSVVLASIGFESEFLEPERAPPALSELGTGELALHDRGMAQRTPEGQIRIQRLRFELEAAVPSGSDTPVRLVDVVGGERGSTFVALTDDGALRYNRVKLRRNLLTGKVTARTRTSDLPGLPEDRGAPDHLLMTGLADTVFVCWEDGLTLRYDTRDPGSPALVETLDLLPDPARRLTTVAMLLGRFTLLAGDDAGGLSAWFLTRPEQPRGTDGSSLTRAHELPRAEAAISSIATSERSRMIAAGDAEGRVRLLQVTTEAELLAVALPGTAAVTALAVAPKEDGLVALSTSGLSQWDIDLAYPEASAASLFRPVWYEGANGPEHVWQSSSATDDFEMKLGLMPLIFGTLKATAYSMLFGAPLALLAAIYTSEFLRHPVKARVKSSIELMASLPSVVLGFLAALVIAPWVEGRLPAVIAAGFTIPACTVFGAYLWQLMPQERVIRWERYRLLGVFATLPVGLLLAAPVGGVVEATLFAGDVKRWLDGQTGSAMPGWLLALFPLSLLIVGWSAARWGAPVLRRMSRERDWGRRTFALIDLGRFLGLGVASLLLALLLSSTLSSLGFDARSWYLGTYVQRNAVIVGFIMGFAIIPIIYTIAEDALTAVPEHLRSASLGAGATPWQTAVRVILPTAMSGLFSALMIGLGRAVGETMIVLMAAGNTPVMEWNVFNGFRTLSANIAVELPEAVRGSTHYRTLFLAALTLFAITFLVNTVAEVIRQRFRKRAFAA
jgi:phosphate transport system permease protein